MYPAKMLLPLYRLFLKVTKNRGQHLLAKIDTRLFPIEREIYIGKRSDIPFFIPADPHFFGFLLQNHENHVKQAITKLSQSGDVIVDIGANIGYFTAYAIDVVGKTGKVFSFEPEKRNFALLQKNCLHLLILGYHCYPFQLAISSKSGKAILNVHRFSTYHSIDTPFHVLDKVESTQEINTITLDEWSINLGSKNITLLKVDTEGHEPQVLEGASRLFRDRRINNAILECRDANIANYIDDFCRYFNLYSWGWDGHKWFQGPLMDIPNIMECLLCIGKLSPNAIN